MTQRSKLARAVALAVSMTAATASPALATNVGRSMSALSAEWWQWAFSIPSSVNPLQDVSGEHCMVGQRSDVWFLGGTLTGESVTRTCSVPEGTQLFFRSRTAFSSP